MLFQRIHYRWYQFFVLLFFFFKQKTAYEFSACLVGSDRSREKSTFVTALGLEGSGALVEQLTEEAVSALNGFPQPDFLIWLARELASRRK